MANKEMHEIPKMEQLFRWSKKLSSVWGATTQVEISHSQVIFTPKIAPNSQLDQNSESGEDVFQMLVEMAGEKGKVIYINEKNTQQLTLKPPVLSGKS